MSRFAARQLSSLTALAALFVPALAHAGTQDVIVLPTVTAAAAAPEDWHPPSEADPPAITRGAHAVDSVVAEAVQDLGLTLDVSVRHEPTAAELTEDGLIAKAKDRWVVSPRIVLVDERTVRVRVTAVAPGSKVVLSESEETRPSEIEVDAVVMLRDLVRMGRGGKVGAETAAHPAATAPAAVVERARSTGRAVLAVNAAALGSYVGFSLQRASGSSDPRLTYPLLALGAGIGLGSSMIVADEWDVGIGDAWYLAAGAWWPGAGGILLAKSYNVPESDRYAYGLVGATGGVVLATVALSFGKMGEGGATTAHSGGAFGLVLGGLGDLMIRGKTDVTPVRGMGYGAVVGVLIGGATATQFRNVSNPNVLFVDLGGSLGALVGAAAASPVLFVEGGSSSTKKRIWLGSIMTCTVAGGSLAWWMARSSDGAQATHSSLHLLPYAGIVAESQDARGNTAPVFGAGVSGQF